MCNGRLLVLSLVVWQAAPLACPVCFGAEPGATTDGLRAAVLVLVSVTVAVLAAFGVFVVRFVGRARRRPSGAERWTT
jgi:hypothetical protein